MFRLLRRAARIAQAATLALPVVLASACSTSGPSGSSDDALNYRSTAGQEFLLSTTVTFTPTATTQALQGEEKDAAVAAEANGLRTTVTSKITSDLDKLWPQDMRISRPGVAIQFRQKTATIADLVPVDGGARYAMTVNAEFAGVLDLEKRLPLEVEGERSYLPVDVDLGQQGGATQLHVFITPIEQSLNAYPKYLELFEDGLDIGAHFGGDHHEPPKDIDHARSLYDDLVTAGFESPVASFADLKIDSGPLKRSIRVMGKDVEVRVRIFHVDMSTPETRDTLIDAYKESARSSDVIIYDGHAGRQLSYSGVVVAYKPSRVGLAASEFKNLETTEKQQVYLFNGCETYSGYADSMYENPNRRPENTDIITTGNFSAIQAKANQVIAFIHALIEENQSGWVPRSWDSILDRMNKVGERSWVHVYGVHGLEDNPRLSPLADPATIGSACSTDADCGASDSLCLQVADDRRVCGAACASSAGCPEGTACVMPRGRRAFDDMQCTAQ